MENSNAVIQLVPGNRKAIHVLTGSVLLPLTVGRLALVKTTEGDIRTSEVVKIVSASTSAISFETANSLYTLRLAARQAIQSIS